MRISQLIDTRPEWIEPSPLPQDSSWRSLDSSPLVSAILYRRGHSTPERAREFMHPESQPSPDPYLIPNMAAAVERIASAVGRRETIGIFGDYDVDGITSTAILAQALRVSLGDRQVITRLPARSEGYGLNGKAIAEFEAADVSLIIAVDCGSSDHVHADAIARAGMDLVIFDHHHMPDSGPDGAITVSPQLNGDGLYHDLTAAGVVYLLVVALAGKGIAVVDDRGNDPGAYLDLAALGTVADVAPIVGVNRQLVAGGLSVIHANARAGIVALAKAAKRDPSNLTAADISFALAPRLNSAGRVGSPQLPFDLLMTNSAPVAGKLAYELEQVNFHRKARSTQVLAEAYDAITRKRDWQAQSMFAVHHERWESGLVGAVASRMVEEVRRPVFLFHEEDGMLTGSARSVDGLNLVETLREAAPLLHRFGGHSLAAGLSLKKENLPHLESHVAGAISRLEMQIPSPRHLRIDANLPPEYLKTGTVNDISRMEPFGRGNDQPLLRVPNADLLQYSVMGSDRTHLKIQAKTGGRQIEAISWGGAWRSQELVARRHIDLVGRLEINSWNGQERLQLVLEDFRAQ